MYMCLACNIPVNTPARTVQVCCTDDMCGTFAARSGRDVGRSVAAYGYWGDVLNSPYHCFGTIAEDPGLFKITNKQFTHTAVDVAEYNIMVIYDYCADAVAVTQLTCVLPSFTCCFMSIVCSAVSEVPAHTHKPRHVMLLPSRCTISSTMLHQVLCRLLPT